MRHRDFDSLNPQLSDKPLTLGFRTKQFPEVVASFSVATIQGMGSVLKWIASPHFADGKKSWRESSTDRVNGPCSTFRGEAALCSPGLQCSHGAFQCEAALLVWGWLSFKTTLPPICFIPAVPLDSPGEPCVRRPPALSLLPCCLSGVNCANHCFSVVPHLPPRSEFSFSPEAEISFHISFQPHCAKL